MQRMSRIKFLQLSRCADERAAGAEHGDEVRHAAFGLLPDFFRGRAVMRAPVRVVRVLVGVEVLPRLRGRKFARFADGAVRAFGCVGEHDLRTVGANRALALLRYVLRHAQGHREALRRAHHGVGNSGIAAGGIQQRLAGPSFPAAMASATMFAAGRSFTEPPGFAHSALASTSTPAKSRVSRSKRSSGVLPIRCRVLSPKRARHQRELFARLCHCCIG